MSLRALILGISLMLCATGCATHRVELMAGHRYRLFFPPLPLATADGERVESIELTMSCGGFRSLTEIPDDWSVQIISPVSEQTRLQASCGHESSALWSLRDLDGVIVITVDEPSCFNVSATVVTATFSGKHEHRFARADLILKP